MKPVVDPELLYRIEYDCLTDVESFFRDSALPAETFHRYRRGYVIKEVGHMDVSEIEGGMAAKCRFHIYSGIAENYKQSFEEYKAWTLPRGCYFKVIHIGVEHYYGLIVLLQIPEYAVEYFALNTHPKEQVLAEEAMARFKKAAYEEPDPVRKQAYWLRRTEFPIGLNGELEFFYKFDYSSFPQLEPWRRSTPWWKRLWHAIRFLPKLKMI